MKESYRRMRIAKLQLMTMRNGHSWGVQKAAMNEIMSLLKEQIEPDRTPPLMGPVLDYLRARQNNPQPMIAFGQQSAAPPTAFASTLLGLPFGNGAA